MILTTNAADLRMKTESLKSVINHFGSTVFSVQETHYRKKGKFNLDNFQIFEALRTKEGGGTMLGVHVSLQPVLVSEYSETFELLVVECKTNNQNIRFITGYGPQETWDLGTKLVFFNVVEEEVSKSISQGISVVIMGDFNSKLGTEYISSDPHEQSENGKILSGMIERNALCVLNGLNEKCTGSTTRQRTTVNGVEKSIIDFVMVSSNLVKQVESIMIDDERKHVLEKVVNTKTGTKRTESDHNIIVTKLNVDLNKTAIKKKEILNLKDIKGQKRFKEKTDDTDELSRIFNSNKDVNTQAKKFMKRLDGFAHECFNKIRVTEKVDKTLEMLYSKRTELRNKSDPNSKAELKKVEQDLDEKYAEKMCDTIKNELRNIEIEDGGWNSGQLWKLKKKISPRPMDPPTAMKNDEGVLLTNPDEITKEAVKYYEKLFEDQPMNENYKQVQIQKEELCSKRLVLAAKNKTDPWDLEDVEFVMNNLKSNKSRDPHGYANELFKKGVAGRDLKVAILKLMNKIKEDQIIPNCMKLCNITNLYKNKGPRNVFNSYRGIFRVTVLRNILDRLIYNDTYQTIEDNLTDCNVGSRKGRNVRDNLFVINAVINQTKGTHGEALDIGVYDVKKCFDTLWNQECINDLYELGFDNDKLPLIYLENETASVAIKSSTGVSRRVSIYNTVMQGTVWAGLMCTATMDKLGKLVYKTPHLLYKYKNSVDIPPLEMVDDVLTVAKCGATSLAINKTVNEFMSSKKLQLNPKKCVKIHIGKKCQHCPKLKVHEGEMKDVEQEKYLGDIIHKSGKPHANIVERISKGYGIISNIRAILMDIPLGNRRVEIGLDLRKAWFLNGILFNSEVWPKLTKQEENDLAKMDQYLLRSILGAHSKVPCEILYLETASIPVNDVIAGRRLNYLHTLVSRPEDELTRKVYAAMKGSPSSGDWCELVAKDKENFKIHMDDDHIMQTSAKDFKEMIKELVRKEAVSKLKVLQEGHQKVRQLQYTYKDKPQEYLSTKIFSNEECSLLFNLRCKTVKGFKDNFHGMNQSIMCDLCSKSEDSQMHALKCHTLEVHVPRDPGVKYSDIYGTIQEQKGAVVYFTALLEARERLLADRGPTLPDPTSFTS